MSRAAVLVASVVATLAGCSDESVSPAPRPVARIVAWEGDLSLELRGNAHVSVDLPGDGSAQVKLQLSDVDTEGLFDPTAPLEAKGSLELLPEAKAELFSATFSLPPSGSGPCSGAPATLALALVHRDGTSRFGGGLTAYCGERAFGVPARVLRLSGVLAERRAF